ncbi:MAG: hypothetical protein K0V04_07350 [Deltaproteobacteria bacterium]|nr:hypothetical protein [Deltaproteobacteria bacterium]
MVPSRRRLALVAACVLPLAVSACGSDNGDDFDADGFDNDRIVVLSGDTCVDLVSGRRANVGSVCGTVDNTVDTSAQCGEGATGVMHVTYQTTGPWELVQARMATGLGLEDIPTNRRGRIRKSLLPFDSGDITGATTHTFDVPLCTFGLDGTDEVCPPSMAHFVAHARVRRQRNNGWYRYRGAWGDGQRLGWRRRHGRFFTMEMSCDDNPVTEQCESAYAAGIDRTCFLGADFDGDGTDDGFADWGWSNRVSPNTSTSFPVYAAVGGCNPTDGSHVGDLAVSYDGSSATIIFNRVGDVTLDEEHLYVGGAPLATNGDGEFTVTPSDYPIVADLDDAAQTTNTVTGLSGDIHVVYHAVACGEGMEPNEDPLDALTDEFLIDGDLTGWDVRNPELAFVEVEEGALELEPEGNTAWYNDQEAVHISRTVSGNFSMTTYLEVTDLAGGTTAGGDFFRFGGLLLRDPSGGPSTYHAGIGHAAEGSVVTVSQVTQDGNTNYAGNILWDNDLAELRICRVDNVINTFIRLPDDPWTMIDNLDSVDLPDTINVGPMAGAYSSSPDLRASFDWVQFQSVSTAQDCWRD